MEYTVVTAHSLWYLKEVVDLSLKDGWKPQGGVCVSPNPDKDGGNIFAQAFIR